MAFWLPAVKTAGFIPVPLCGLRRGNFAKHSPDMRRCVDGLKRAWNSTTTSTASASDCRLAVFADENCGGPALVSLAGPTLQLLAASWRLAEH
jgi:hypothetical protein